MLACYIMLGYGYFFGSPAIVSFVLTDSLWMGLHQYYWTGPPQSLIRPCMC